MELSMVEIMIIVDTLRASLEIEDRSNRIFKFEANNRRQVLVHLYTQLDNIKMKLEKMEEESI